MAAFIPFNFNPASVSVETSGSSTVPAGQYAHVTATVSGTGTFSINGTVAQNAKTSTVTTQTSTALIDIDTGAGTGLSTAPFNTGGTTSPAFGYTAQQVHTSTTGSYWLPSGATITVSGDAKAVIQLFDITNP